MSGLADSSIVCKKSSSGLSSVTLKKSALWASRRSRAMPFYIPLYHIAAKLALVKMGGDKLP
jgi:hypothetical protein